MSGTLRLFLFERLPVDLIKLPLSMLSNEYRLSLSILALVCRKLYQLLTKKATTTTPDIKEYSLLDMPYQITSYPTKAPIFFNQL
jgi:hypothetical protein